MNKNIAIENSLYKIEIISQYESLRNMATNSNCLVQEEGLGLALFLYKGFANWISCSIINFNSVIENEKNNFKIPIEKIDYDFINESNNFKITSLIANMILGHNKELHHC